MKIDREKRFLTIENNEEEGVLFIGYCRHQRSDSEGSFGL